MCYNSCSRYDRLLYGQLSTWFLVRRGAGDARAALLRWMEDSETAWLPWLHETVHKHKREGTLSGMRAAGFQSCVAVAPAYLSRMISVQHSCILLRRGGTVPHLMPVNRSRRHRIAQKGNSQIQGWQLDQPFLGLTVHLTGLSRDPVSVRLLSTALIKQSCNCILMLNYCTKGINVH